MVQPNICLLALAPKVSDCRSSNAYKSELKHLRQEQDDSALFLHYDSQARDLRPYFWPVLNGQRVVPEELPHHRVSHTFRNPCCFCAASYSQIAYTESEVQLIRSGPNSGEWVVRCVTNGCGYFVRLERLYPKQGLLLKIYAERHVAPFIRIPRIASTNKVIDEQPAASSNLPTTLDQLYKLDSWLSPGLSEVEFRSLFVKCRSCGLVMTRRVRKQHACAVIRRDPPAIIDLTMDSPRTIIDLTDDNE